MISACFDCKAKSADCAYGDLQGSQSCEDAKMRILQKENKDASTNKVP